MAHREAFASRRARSDAGNDDRSHAVSGPGLQAVRSGGVQALPPHDLEAERAVLGALLIQDDSSFVLRLLDRKLTPGCFYWEQHRRVYEAMVSLGRRRIPIDQITVRTEMEKLGTKDATTQAQIDELAAWVPAAGNFLHYADIVVAKARWRKRLAVAYEMLAAVEKQNDAAWSKMVQVFSPAEEEEPEKLPDVVVLRTVNEDGEVVGEERHCPSCHELRDQVKGLEKDLRAWRVRYANLERDKEADARADGMWQLAQRLFEFWKALTGHTRSPFTHDRFYEVAPFLRRPEHGPEKVARAIVGIQFDPFKTQRKNGTWQTHNGWHLIFKTADQFEEYANKTPEDWRTKISPELKKYIRDFLSSERMIGSQSTLADVMAPQRMAGVRS